MKGGHRGLVQILVVLTVRAKFTQISDTSLSSKTNESYSRLGTQSCGSLLGWI